MVTRFNMSKIYWIVFFCAFSAQLHAQKWVKTNGPYGGSIKDIVVHPNGTVYALGDSPNRSIFRSADGGNTWTTVEASALGNDVHSINDLKLANDGTVYALGYSNLYKTADDGTTWVKVNTVTGSNAGGFDSGDEIGINILSNTLYVMGYSNDGQQTVFRSTNGGSTWTKGYQGRIFTNFVSNSLGEVYALSSGQTWKSTNDGTVFTQLATPVPSDIVSGANFITAKSDGSQIAVVTGSSNIYTLTAPFPSATWTAVTETNIADPTTYGFWAKLLYSADNSTLFLFDGNNNKVYSRTTGNWTTPLTTSFITSKGEDPSCVASKDASTVYVGAQEIGIYKSINGGAGWTEVNNGIENLSMNNLVVANDGSIVGAGDFAYRSADNGQSWSRIPTDATGYTVIKSSTSNTLLLLGHNGNTSYKSTNSGVDWTAIATATAYANKFVSPDGTKIAAYTYNKLFYSGDGGTTWSNALTISGFPTTANFSSFTDSEWVVMDQNSNIFAFVYDSGSGYKMFKIVPNSTSSPTTAIATEIPLSTVGLTSVTDLKFLDNKIYVLGYGNNNYALATTADAGVTWTQKTAPAADRLDVDSKKKYLFVTESNNSNYKIYLSRDNGSAYVSSTIDLPSSTTPYGISVSPDGIAYAGYTGSSIYKTSSTIVVPAAPSNVVSLGRGTDRIMLACDDNEPISHYVVIEKFNGTDYDTLLRTGTMQSPGKIAEEIGELDPNTSYQFRVSAYNSAGSSPTVSITVSTLEACASTLPDNRSWSGNVNGTTTLTNVSIRAIADGVYSISDVNNGATSAATVVPGTFAIGCSGGASNTYLYPDSPVIPNGNGTWNSGTKTLVLKWVTEQYVTTVVSGTVTLTVNATDPTPQAPTNVAAYAFSDNSAEVGWDARGFETQFTIERKTGVGGTYASVGTVDYPATSFVDPGPLVAGTTYFYRVKSRNGNPTPGVSSYSNEAQITFKKPNFVLATTTVNNTKSNTLGAVWSDFNNDGFDDLLLTKFNLFSTRTSTPILFQNDGAGNFAPAASDIEPGSYANATAADYNNDGKIDLFYSAFRSLNYLYNGNGSFNFTRVSPSPVEGDGEGDFETGAPFSAAWVDYDKDGLLDLFVARTGLLNSELYKQNSDHTFTKVTNAGDLVNTLMRLFGIAWADYDNDGDMDVFAIDQGSGDPDRLFRNNNDGTFSKVTGSAFDSEGAMNSSVCSWADFDNDQDFDLFIGTNDDTHYLFRNNGNGTFTKLTTTAFTIKTPGQALGSNWIDINNDGFVDLIVTGQEGNVIFLNSNGTSFTAVNSEKISDTRLLCISAASSDYNNDGFMDLILSRTALQGEGDLGTPQNTLLLKNTNTTGNWIKVKLTGVTSNKSAIGAKIKATTGSKTQMRQVASHIDITSQNSLTQHFGLGSSTKVDNLTVIWPSGIVQSLTNVGANSTITIVEDGAGPAITSRTPANAAQNVSVSTTISITLDEPGTAIAGKKLNIALTSDPGTPVQSFDVTSASLAGNTYTFTLTSALGFNSNYTVTLDAGAFQDAYANNSLAVAAGNWTFTTAEEPDTEAPQIKDFVNPGSLAKGFGTASPTLTVTDNKGVKSVTLHIRKISGSDYSVVAATPGATASAYSVTISEIVDFDPIGAEFFITADDDAGNVVRDPADPGTHKVYLTYNASQAIIPATSIGFGGAKTGWKVFSVPFELTSGNNNVSSIFEELAGKDSQKDYRLITLKNDQEWSEYPSGFATINRGTGYFINIRTDPGAIDLFDGLQAPQNSRSNLYQMNLKAGWNMIGNPYLTPISWADVATLNGLTGAEGQLKTFSGGTYSNDQTLAPYEGGFVLMSSAKTVSIPFQGQTASGGRQGVRNLGEDMSADSWALPLTINQSDISYTLGGIGMAPDANASIDNYDDVTPPRFIDYLELNFKHPEHIARNFTREIVPTQQNYTWEFTVDSNLEGMAELTWNNAPLITSGKDLFLLDLSTQQLVNMKETGTHRFDPKESSRFRIYYGDNLNLAPERIHLGHAYPNPTEGNTAISFSLPETGGLNQSVSLEIIDALGHTIGTVVQGKYNPGYHEADFDARGLPGGFYTYRLAVKNRGGQTVEVQKLIVK